MCLSRALPALDLVGFLSLVESDAEAFGPVRAPEKQLFAVL